MNAPAPPAAIVEEIEPESSDDLKGTILLNDEAVTELFNKMVKKENPGKKYQILNKEKLPDGSYKGVRKSDKKMFVIKNVNFKEMNEL